MNDTEIFNLKQRALQVSGKKPLFCQCIDQEICFYTDFTPDAEEFPELEKCEECKRLVPYCYMSDGDFLCNSCYTKKNWQNRSVVSVVLGESL